MPRGRTNPDPMPMQAPVLSPTSFRPTAAALAGGLLLALAGCAGTPPAPTDALAAVPAGWKSATAAGWISTADLPADVAPAWRDGQWWRLFNDPVLDELAQQVAVGNQNLALALANVAQAEALLRQQQAALSPTLSASLSAGRSGRPARGSASLGLSGSWAPDLWGRLQGSVDAQGANVQVSQADLAAARLAVQGSLASAYLSVREADAELALLADIIAGYQRAVTITRNRYQAGIAAHTDLLQAQSTLANAEASRAALQASRANNEHAIALLLGKPPADFSLPAGAWSSAVPPLPLTLPSELLLRRPDVAAAERAVVAANARIGVARAAYFPSFNLSAGVGGSADKLAQLFSAPTLAWSLGLALAQTVFDGGARSAAVDQAVAAHQGATASYRQAALAALGEVENLLTTQNALATQLAQARIAADAASGAEQRIMNSYQAGLSAYTDVVSAQASALSARRSVLQLQLQLQQGAVSLVQALGGGWQVPWGGAAAPAGAP